MCLLCYLRLKSVPFYLGIKISKRAEDIKMNANRFNLLKLYTYMINYHLTTQLKVFSLM